MRYLMDTLTFLRFVTDDARLPEATKHLICTTRAEINVSAVSLLEIHFKSKVGKIDLEEGLDLVREIANSRLALLPLTPQHCEHMQELSLHGEDIPEDFFRKMLLAQAEAEGLDLLAHDTGLHSDSLAA